MSSTAFNFYALTERSRLNVIKECSKLNDIEQIISYLKKTDTNTIAKCHRHNGLLDIDNITWMPTIESAETPGAFLTKTPEEIYESGAAPMMDVMFSFTSKVFK